MPGRGPDRPHHPEPDQIPEDFVDPVLGAEAIADVADDTQAGLDLLAALSA